MNAKEISHPTKSRVAYYRIYRYQMLCGVQYAILFELRKTSVHSVEQADTNTVSCC